MIVSCDLLPDCLQQLEDDIVARPNYFTTMKNFALQQPLEEWMILEFSQLGFIGWYQRRHRQGGKST